MTLAIIGILASAAVIGLAYNRGRIDGMVALSSHLQAHGHITTGAAICADRFMRGEQKKRNRKRGAA